MQSRTVVASSRGRSAACGRYQGRGSGEIRWAVDYTVEKLEHRTLLSSYVWNPGAGTLLIDFGTNDQMTIAEAAGTRSFHLTNGGVFFNSGGTFAAGNGTGTITFFAADNIGTSITVNNAGNAAPSNESVTFLGGNLTSGTITVDLTQTAGTSSAISFSTAATNFSTSAVTLQSPTAISEGAGGSISTTTGTLALAGATGVGTSANPLVTAVGTLVARAGTGGIFLGNTGALTIGFAGEPFAGVQVTGASGDIGLTDAGTITLSRMNDIIKGPGNVTVAANGATSDLSIGTNNGLISPGGSGSIVSTGTTSVVSLQAGRDVLVGRPTLGNLESAGSIVMTAGRNINVDSDSFIEAHGRGRVTATAGGNISLLHTQSLGAHISSEGGAISLTTGIGGVFTADSAGTSSGVFSTSGGGNGPITIAADDMVIASGAISAGSGIVALQPATPISRAIDLGGGTTAGELGLSDAELGRIIAGTLRIGRTDNPGNISLTAPVTAHAGYATLSLQTGGRISDNASTDTIRATNLAVRAGSGISLDTAVSDLAFTNTAGAVSIRNTGALSITAVDGLTSSTNLGTTITLNASSPITFATNLTSAGTLSVTTTETASETGTPLPPPDDNLTINSGVTVESTGGDVNLTSGDSVVIQSTSTVKSDTGAVNLMIGSGDNDNDASLTANGTLSASTVRFTTAGDIFMDQLPTALTNRPGQTLAITSTGGGIFDNTTPDGASDDTDVTAGTLALSAATGIGTASDPLETVVSNLSAQTATGGIFLSNTGVLNISGGVISGVNGVRVLTSGDVVLINAGSINIPSLSDIVKTPGNIALTANGASANIQTGGNNDGTAGTGAVNAGGTATVTVGQDLLVGSSTLGFGDIDGGGSVIINVGRDLVDNSGFIDAHGAGTATVNAGRNVTITSGRISSQSGVIGIGTGVGGFFSVGAAGLVGSNLAGSGAPITISADDMAIAGPVNAGSGIVALQQTSTATRAIDLGGGTTAGDLGLSDAELALVSAGILRIGRTDNPGNISLTAPVTAHAGYATLSLQTGGSIQDSNSLEPDVHVTNLALRAGNGISLDTAASNIAFSNVGGTLNIRNTGALTIGSVDGLTSSSNAGTTTTLSAASPITFAVNTTSAGTLSATTTETATEITTPLPPPDDGITVSAGVTVQSAGGDVILQAADGLTIQSAAHVLSPNGNIDLRTGFGDSDNDATMTLNGTVAANPAAGTVALNANVSGGSVSETATGTISGASLLLLNSPASGGLFALDTSTTNSVATIAATTHATISFRDATALTVGKVTSGNEGITSNGILTNNQDVTLATTSGDITLAQAVNADSATVRMDAAGGVTQTAAGKITASNLGVVAAGNILLAAASPTNHVTGVFTAAAGPAAIAFQDDAPFTVAAIAASGTFPGASGLVANQDITLVLGSGIIIISADVTTNHALTLSPLLGGIQQTAGVITAMNFVQTAGAVQSTYAGKLQSLGGGGMQFNGSDFAITGPVVLLSPLTMNNSGSATISGSVSGTAGIIMNGSGTLTLSGANSYTAATTVNSGTLVVAGVGSLPPAQNVVNNAFLHIDANSSPSQITGSGTLFVNALLTIASFAQGPVNILGSGNIKLQSSAGTTSTASALSIVAPGKLDLSNDSLRISYAAGSDPIASIRSYLASGYNGGTWNGTGIDTSAADANHGLGFGDSADGAVSGLPANTILVRWTRPGDVNLDATVGFADLLTLAQHYGSSGQNWDQGDMNYDGTVNFADLLTLAQNYGATAAVQQTAAVFASTSLLPDPSDPRNRRRAAQQLADSQRLLN